jgi:hypothetical protein
MHFLALLLALPLNFVDTRAPELGRVVFGRDLDTALAQSKSSGKPVFALFDEIPGCATCQGFGRGPLSNLLLVEAIETQFVPLVIHNNSGGADAEALKKFGEPSMNNPVVRFLDARGADVIARADGVWTESGIADRIVAALEAAHRDVPAWLALARDELDPTPPSRAVFSMACFWEGQGRLGAIDGVVDAHPCFVEGSESCEVLFRPSRIAYSALVKRARELECAGTVWAADADQEKQARTIVGENVKRLTSALRAAPASDDLRSLKADATFLALPLTRGQRVRLNGLLLNDGMIVGTALTPRQAQLGNQTKAALRERPKVLEGLDFPADPHDLGAYEDELRARVSAR